MRGTVDGLANPHPMAAGLPSMFLEDDFTLRFISGLDEVLAPILHALDNVPAYLDPSLAPPDFVAWLAGWMGLALDENWELGQRRALVAQALDLYRWRGTRRGLTEHVSLYCGVEPEIEDSGGVAWAAAPGGDLPGEGDPTMVVRVRVADPGELDEARLDRLVVAAKPAHVSHRVEVVAS